MVPTENAVLPIERAIGSKAPDAPPQTVVQRYFDNVPTVQIDDDTLPNEWSIPNPAPIAGPSHIKRITGSTNTTHFTTASAAHSEYLPPETHSTEKHTMTEAEFDDFCRDFKIPIYKSEELLSRFKNWNWIDPTVTIAHVRKRHHVFDPFFDTYSSLVYCRDINGLFSHFSHQHNPAEWTLFMDSSTQSM